MPSALPMRGLRMTDELYLKLKEIARLEDRSYNQQAVRILSQYVANYEKENGVINVDVNSLYR